MAYEKFFFVAGRYIPILRVGKLQKLVLTCLCLVFCISFLEYSIASAADVPERKENGVGTVEAKKDAPKTVLVREIEPELGFAYKIYVEAFGDDPKNSKRSKLLLLEDGVLIGPGHSLHAKIRKFGNGRFSHWGQTIYFSTSDNSDPRTNGRTYSYRIQASSLSKNIGGEGTTPSYGAKENQISSGQNLNPRISVYLIYISSILLSLLFLYVFDLGRHLVENCHAFIFSVGFLIVSLLYPFSARPMSTYLPQFVDNLGQLNFVQGLLISTACWYILGYLIFVRGNRVFPFLMMFAVTTSVLAGGQKSPILALVAGLGVFLVSFLTPRLGKALVVLFSVTILIVIPVIAMNVDLTVVLKEYPDLIGSYGERIILWEYYSGKISQDWLIGLGPGWQAHTGQIPAVNLIPNLPDSYSYMYIHPSLPHSMALGIWLDFGAVGAVFVMGIILGVCKIDYEHRLGMPVLASLSAFLAGTFAGGSLVAPFFLILLSILRIHFLVLKDFELASSKLTVPQPSKILFFALTVLPVAMAIFLFWSVDAPTTMLQVFK